MRGLLATVALLLTACVDVCARAEELSGTFQARHAACYAPGTLPSPAFDGARCDDSMDACTAADEQRLQAYFGCLEALPVCTEATKAEFNAAVLGCAKEMMTLSAGCFRP